MNNLFHRVRINLFYFITILFIVGNIIDIFSLNILRSDINYFINLSCILISSLLIILFSARKIPVHLSNIIIIYLILFNLIVGLISGFHLGSFDKYVLRETIFIGILILATGFMVNKKHVLIIGFLYISFFVIIVILSELEFLEKNLVLLNVAMISYVGWAYYLFHIIEEAYVKQEQLINRLNIQNDLLTTRKNELKTSNTTKDKLFSVIAHDLLGSFNIIMGYSKLLNKRIDKKDIDEIKKYGIRIHSAATNTSNLLINLLNWARSQTNHFEFSPVEVNLKSLVNEIIQLFHYNMMQKNIHVHVDIEDNFILLADENMVKIIIRNLLSNAIKFSFNNGQITIRSNNTDHAHVVSIADKGIGMNSETMNSLFGSHSFTTTGTNNEKGTGLGLMICEQLIKMHGGRIWAESEENEGSVFTFSIPMERQGITPSGVKK